MAASGYTPIVLLNSGCTGHTPTTCNLRVGELAINYADGKLFYNNGSTIKTLVNASATGTVTSVGATVPSFLSVSGSPVTTSGTLAIGYSGTPLPIANGGTGTTSTTFANLTTNVTGTLPIANGGTNSTATPTAGTIAYGTGTAIAYTSVGTTGQVLTSAGSGAPTWSAPYGAMTKIGTYTLSGSSTTYLLSLTGGFNRYLLILDNWNTPTGQVLEMQLAYGGTPTIITSGYVSGGVSTASTSSGFGASATLNSNNTSYFNLGSIGNNSSYGGTSAMIYVNNVNGSYATIFGNIIFPNGSTTITSANFNGRVLNSNAITAVNFLNGGSGTDYFSGSITVYGIN